jgi:hypothetical protein
MAATGPVTLRHLVREDKLLWVYGGHCHREVTPHNAHSAAD